MSTNRRYILGMLLLASLIVVSFTTISTTSVLADKPGDHDGDIAVILCSGADLRATPDSQGTILASVAPGDVVRWWLIFGRIPHFGWVQVFWMPGGLVGWIPLDSFRAGVLVDRELISTDRPGCAW